jgi:hypothetical protein
MFAGATRETDAALHKRETNVTRIAVVRGQGGGHPGKEERRKKQKREKVRSGQLHGIPPVQHVGPTPDVNGRLAGTFLIDDFFAAGRSSVAIFAWREKEVGLE